jgi:UDP-N-acetylmuramoylalanine--D-glutamate ligase
MNKTNSPYFLIIGLGKSGMSMAKFLCSKGENVIATDIDESKLNIAKELNELGIKTQIGFHDQKTFNNAKIMIPSPGISLNNKYIKTALNKGVEITGELDIFTKHNDLPIIAITGTNGKTTVTTLIGKMLQQSKMMPFVGGNIGTPLIEHLMAKNKSDGNNKTDIIVAEISSFQLDLSRQFRPDVGVLLNISQDHLDRYKNFEEYINSKWSIFKNQTSSDTAVINQSTLEFCHESDQDVDQNFSQNLDSVSQKIKSKSICFSSKNNFKECDGQINPKEIKIKFKNDTYKIPTDNLKELQGTHNQENIAAACIASLAAGADFNNILKGLADFQNLSHRVELVKTINGISFYNDSKATNTDAVIRAIECFKNNIILILGGREKSTDFSLLINKIKKRVKTIIALGETSSIIKDTFEKICPVKVAETMNSAVQTAFALALKNDIVLLSPACASFDMYKSYTDRGDDFTNCVKTLAADKSENR